jgi:Tfp pilus assembly protein PilF
VRWLKGDLDGAREAMKLAARAATPHDPESAAWVNSRLAWYEFQAGAFDNARAACASALDYQPDYPPALLLKGRLLLGEAQPRAAVESLRRACQLNPQPEYQWWFSEALREAGQIEEARSIEAQLSKEGELNDPRTLCLFLATRSENVSSALRLAQNEMKTREDVFTLDALAWAEAAAGQWPEANATMSQALSAGTRDARLFLHAGIIAAKMADRGQANLYLEQAVSLIHTLLPSEQRQWEIAAAEMALSMAPASANPELSASNQ